MPAASQGNIGYGTLLAMTTHSSITMEVVDISLNKSTDEIEFTHTNSPVNPNNTTQGAKEYKPGLFDAGPVNVTVNFANGIEWPVGEVDTFTITYSNGDTEQFTGFISNAGTEIPVGDRMQTTLQIRPSTVTTYTSV